ncbi:MAG: peptidase M23 [Mycobacteriales bacterium]
MSSPVSFSAAGGGGAGGGGAPPRLEHACLEVREPPSGGTTSSPGPVRDTINFQFNPKELSLTKTAKWKRDAQRGAKKSGVPEFTGSDPCKLQLEMFLDATEHMDSKVVTAVEKLFALCVPTDQTLNQKKPSPPWVIFRWGGLTGFPAFVSSVTAKYTLFTPSGMPVRATCTVAIEEIAGATPGQNPTSGALAARKVHTVVAGDSLQMMAFQEYGDPNRWRVIAEANRIDDPMWLPPGTVLLVPALEELDSGQ